MSCIASAVSWVITEDSTVRKRRPPGPFTTSTPSSVTRRYSVRSSPVGNSGEYEKAAALLMSGNSRPAPARGASRSGHTRIPVGSPCRRHPERQIRHVAAGDEDHRPWSGHEGGRVGLDLGQYRAVGGV